MMLSVERTLRYEYVTTAGDVYDVLYHQFSAPMYAAHKGKCPINLILVEWGLTLKITCYLVIHADEISMALKSFKANCSMENVHLDLDKYEYILIKMGNLLQYIHKKTCLSCFKISNKKLEFRRFNLFTHLFIESDEQNLNKKIIIIIEALPFLPHFRPQMRNINNLFTGSNFVYKSISMVMNNFSVQILISNKKQRMFSMF